MRYSGAVKLLSRLHRWLLHHDSIGLDHGLLRLAELLAEWLFDDFIVFCHFGEVAYGLPLRSRCHLCFAWFRVVLVHRNNVGRVGRNTGLVLVRQLVHGP